MRNTLKMTAFQKQWVEAVDCNSWFATGAISEEQPQPLLNDVDADEESGGDNLLGHALLPHRLEGVELVERMKEGALFVLGERDLLDQDASRRIRHDAGHWRGLSEALAITAFTSGVAAGVLAASLSPWRDDG